MKLLFSLLLTLVATAHTLVFVRCDRVDAANALATSATFDFNGDGEPAFVTRLYPGGDTNAPATNCWSWTAATFTPERRAALTHLAASPTWTNHVLLYDYDLSADPEAPIRMLATNSLSLPPSPIFLVQP